MRAIALGCLLAAAAMAGIVDAATRHGFVSSGIAALLVSTAIVAMFVSAGAASKTHAALVICALVGGGAILLSYLLFTYVATR